MTTRLKKQLRKPKKTVNILAGLLSVLFLPTLSVAQTSTIDTLTGWNQSDNLFYLGLLPTVTPTYGQTFTPTSDQTNLNSFSFKFSAETPTLAPIQYSAQIYQWNGTNVTGSALFTSPLTAAPISADYTTVTLNTGGVGLTSGQQYVVFFTTVGQTNTQNTFSRYRLASRSDAPYTLGAYVAQYQQSNPTSASSPWSVDNDTDLAFLLEFGPLIPLGPSTADTQISLQLSANRLRGIYNLQSSALVNGLSYDCQVFDKNNICLSTGGRHSNNHGASGGTSSALLIGAYRLNKNVRVGAWVDQNLSASTTTGVSLGNSKPLFGVFGAWSENPTGEGYEVKVSAGYGDKDLTVTRDVIGTSEAGVGTSRLNSQAISSVSSYGFRINNEMLASPYVGIRYSRIASNGYTESAADMTAPLTYNKLTQENVVLLAGLRLSVKLDPKTTFVASAGVEQNLKNRSGQYSASGVDDLTPIGFNSNPQKTRATASIGAFYDIDKKQRVSVNGIYREETFKPTATTAVLATYTVGF